MKSNGSNKTRIIYIDILRVVSVFSVILLHTSASFVENLYANDTKIWWIGNIIDSSTRWCVPVLIMISGNLVLDNYKEEKIFIFLSKRFSKILIPLIFWSFLYMLSYDDLVLLPNISIFWIFIIKFYEGNVYIHLWYLYMLVGLYLVTPIIKGYVNNSSKSNIIYFLIICFISNGIIGFLEKFTELKTDFNLDFFHWSIGYYVLGFFLSNQYISKEIRNKLYIMGIIGLITTVYITYVLTKNNNGVLVPHFYSYFAPNIIFMSIGVFLICKNTSWKKLLNNKLSINRLVINLSNKSFGIYLVHLLILNMILSRTMNMLVNIHYLYVGIAILLISVITFLASYCIVLVLQRIPLFKSIVPK